jgi:hypothetical protein
VDVSKRDYRLYSWVNVYLSPIQHGIQTAHVTSELFAKYHDMKSETAVLQEWARSDKTIIILQGGNAAGIRSAYSTIRAASDLVAQDGVILPYAVFHEDEDSLDNAITAAGVILPYEMWDVKEIKDTVATSYFLNSSGSAVEFETQPELYNLLSLVKRSKLA